MTNMPCHDCANLIGTVSANSPHAELKIRTIRNRSRTGSGDHRVEFYLCRKCQTVLVRDLHRDDPHAQWDGVKSRNTEDSSILETHK
jgi:hypothetical protein